jgi:hypothetical protein
LGLGKKEERKQICGCWNLASGYVLCGPLCKWKWAMDTTLMMLSIFIFYFIFILGNQCGNSIEFISDNGNCVIINQEKCSPQCDAVKSMEHDHNFIGILNPHVASLTQKFS